MWAKVGLGSGSYDGVMSTLEPPGSNAGGSRRAR
jgi:hypothetical protein